MIKKAALSLAILLSLILNTPAVCLGDIYKYVDPDGVIHLTNVPTEPNVPYVLVMKEKIYTYD